MTHLVPCTACGRHVRADETCCPFCTSALPPAGPAPSIPRVRLTRAAVFAGALAVAATTAAGCGAATEPRNEDAGAEDAPDEPDAPLPMPYGAPPARTRLA